MLSYGMDNLNACAFAGVQSDLGMAISLVLSVFAALFGFYVLRGFEVSLGWPTELAGTAAMFAPLAVWLDKGTRQSALIVAPICVVTLLCILVVRRSKEREARASTGA